MTSPMQRQSGASDPARTPLAEAHHRVVEIHYALAAADQIDENLHIRTLDRLSELLELLADAQRAEMQTTASRS